MSLAAQTCCASCKSPLCAAYSASSCFGVCLCHVLAALCILHTTCFARMTCFVGCMQLPSDTAQYQDVQQLFQEVQSYQQLFVDLHRATTASTPTGEDPSALKAKLVLLDTHKQQLQDKLSKLRGKVQNVGNLPALQVSSAATAWLTHCMYSKTTFHMSERLGA